MKVNVFSTDELCLAEDDATVLQEPAEEIEGRPSRHLVSAEHLLDDADLGQHEAGHTAQPDSEHGAIACHQLGQGLVGLDWV